MQKTRNSFPRLFLTIFSVITLVLVMITAVSAPAMANGDTDFDGLSDFDESNVYFTDPYDSDTDDDLLPDGAEVALGTNPTDSDTDNDGLPDGGGVRRH